MQNKKKLFLLINTIADIDIIRLHVKKQDFDTEIDFKKFFHGNLKNLYSKHAIIDVRKLADDPFFNFVHKYLLFQIFFHDLSFRA